MQIYQDHLRIAHNDTSGDLREWGQGSLFSIRAAARRGGGEGDPGPGWDCSRSRRPLRSETGEASHQDQEQGGEVAEQEQGGEGAEQEQGGEGAEQEHGGEGAEQEQQLGDWQQK
jgi:hypothetical protein